MKAILKRTSYTDQQTLGILSFYSGNDVKLIVKTLELPWKSNAKKKSCIPPGEYKVIRRTSDKYGNHWHILDVKDRDFILIHAANYVRQLEGCIAVGLTITDIDGDGLQDVTNSRQALEKINSLSGNEFILEIV